MKFKLLAGPSGGNIFVVRNWYETELRTEEKMERETEKERDGETERETETRVNDLLASGVTTKRSRGYALTV